MGRIKSFDENEVLRLCASTFIAYGYEGTSIDQIVSSTGLLRGSLYSAYGSKRGIFIATLKEVFLDKEESSQKLDLCLVALLELAPKDDEVKSLVTSYFDHSAHQDNWSQVLGERLLTRAGISMTQNK